MSIINSESPEINNLNFEPLPSRKVLADARVVKVRDTVVITWGNNRVYSSSIRQGFAYPKYCDFDSTLEGCMRLGLISKEAYAQHIEAGKAKRTQRARESLAHSFDAAAKSLGIKLTNAQRGTIERLTK